MNTRSLLEKLLACRSLTPDDAGAMALMNGYLSNHGFSVQAIDFAEVKNLWAISGNGGPLTVLAGHVDVVTAGDESQWRSPPFTPSVRHGYLYGRGAADMKAGIAAMSVAATTFIQANPNYRGTIAIMLTADEEGPAQNGIRRLMPYLHARGVDIDYAVFTEPSSLNQLGDTIKNGRRGSMHAYLEVCGKQGHVAYPDKAANPIHALAPMTAALCREVWCQGNDSFPATSMQVWEIAGGAGAANVIPAAAHANFNFRFSNALNSAMIQSRVEAIVEAELKRYNKISGKDFSHHLRYDVSGEPFLTTEGELLNAMRKSCIEVLGIEPKLSTSGGTSDARFVAPYGAQVIEFGPVNATIHQVNECVKVADLEPLTATFVRLLEKLHR